MHHETIGDRLKKAREASGLQQKEAAEKIGISNALLCKYERNAANPPYDILIKLADLYNFGRLTGSPLNSQSSQSALVKILGLGY